MILLATYYESYVKSSVNLIEKQIPQNIMF